MANAHAYCWSHLVQLVYLWVADVRAFATANHKYTRTDAYRMSYDELIIIVDTQS